MNTTLKRLKKDFGAHQAMVAKPEPLVVIVGETASGKSALAMELARHFKGEIVAADAWTVYKDFNIGTAKPSAVERVEIPHHMLDVTTAEAGYSAAVFKDAALGAIHDISARGKLPLLVGGTGLYVDSVLYDYSFLPAPSNQERERLNAKSIDALLVEAHDKGLDTTGVDTRNKRRIIRLLENNGATAGKGALRPDTLVLGVDVPREKLRERIVQRVDMMLEAGLEQEVARLATQYGWNVEPMKGIGYREFREYFDGTQTFNQTRERIIAGTTRLAKKQRTWFRRNKGIHWISERGQAVEHTTTFLNKYHI